jgi:4-hydroxy-tetrahydrodipicolinate synthase
VVLTGQPATHSLARYDTKPPHLQLHGIVAPVVTPYTADGAIDTASMRRVVTDLIDGGVQGLFALGSTGECVFLNPLQCATVGESIVDEAAGRVPWWAT